MTELETDFASAERLNQDDVYLQTIKVLGLRNAIKVMNILPNFVAILNMQRQVIFANNAFTKAIGRAAFEEGLGLRPGELLECVNSDVHIHGCGTSKNCRYCGVVLTILKAQETGMKQEDTAKITVRNNDTEKTLNFHVVSSPLTFDNEIFYIVVISNQVG